MATWHEITRDPEYQELTPEGKSLVKRGFFDRVIATDPEYQTFSEDTKKAIFDDFWQTPDDTGQGYVTSMLGAAGRGFGEMVPGAIEGVGALTGSEDLREFGQDVRGGLESISPVNPIYAESIPVKLAGVGGQVGSVLATAGAGGAVGKALGGVGAVGKGAQTAALGSAFLQGAAEGRREAEQYGMEGPEAYMRTLAGGAIEAGTEFLPFGMASETALAKRMFAGAPKTSSFLGAVGSEAGEESLGQVGSNIATKTLAPIGVETPGITEGALEAGAYGAFGGGLIGGVNALISTPPEKQTQIQKDLQAEAGAIPKDTVPDQTNEEKIKAMEQGGITVVDPEGKTAVITPETKPELSMPDPAEVAKTIGESSVEQLAATGNKVSAAAQKGFNAILDETLGKTPEPAIQPEQTAEEVEAEVTPKAEEPLSEGAERNRAVIAEAAAKLRGEAPKTISAGVKAAIPQQPAITPNTPKFSEEALTTSPVPVTPPANITADTLPPIPEGMIRLTHGTSGQSIRDVLKSGRFNYSKQVVIDATTDSFSNNQDLAKRLNTNMAGPMSREKFGDKVIIMDVPLDEYRKLRSFSPDNPGFVPANRIVAVYDSNSKKIFAPELPKQSTSTTTQQTQENAPSQIPIEESLRQEPQDRIESREAEETIARDQLLRPAEGEVQGEVVRSPKRQAVESVFNAIQSHLDNGGDFQIPGNPPLRITKKNANQFSVSSDGDLMFKRGKKGGVIPITDVAVIGSQVGSPFDVLSLFEGREVERPVTSDALAIAESDNGASFERLTSLIGDRQKAADEIETLTGKDVFSAWPIVVDAVADSVSVSNGQFVDTEAKAEKLRSLYREAQEMPASRERADAIEQITLASNINQSNRDSIKRKKITPPTEPTPATEGMVTPGGVATFKTSKGSEYVLYPDGTTVRNKAKRPEHPGEEGIMPKSSRTIFVTPEGMDALGIVQSEGIKFQIEQLKDGRWGARALDGPNAGKFYKTSLTQAFDRPNVGLIPVEIWNRRGKPQGVHFGNTITEVSQTKQAAKTQTPVPLREGTGAAGVVQSEPSGGSIPEVAKVSTETETTSSGKLDAVAQIDRLVQSGAKPEEMDKFVKSLTDDQFNELVASNAFDVKPRLAIKPNDSYDIKRNKRREFVNAVNTSTKEVRKTAQQVFQEEEAAAKKQQAGEEMRSKAIDSIIGKGEKRKRKFGQVTNSDAIAAVAMLVSSKDIPGVLTTWWGTKGDFLRDPANQTADPEIYARIKAGELVEGFFNKGRAYVFLDGIGVSNEDMLRGEQMGVSPQVAAVRRVLLHESLVHRGIHGLPLRHRRLILNWVRQNSTPAELDDLAKLYTEYANWRNSDYQFEALAEEFLAKKVDSLTEIPKDGPMAKLMDILRQIWDFIVGYKREPTLSDLKSVVKLLKSGAEALSNDRLKDGGGVKLSYAGEKAIENLPEERRQFMRDSLETAKAMAAAGKDSEEIRAVTGWFPGKYDGKMRWEVPDDNFLVDANVISDMLSGKRSGALVGELITHPGLFNAYPEIKDLAVVFADTGDASAQFTELADGVYAIRLNREKWSPSSILHEIQHWIQRKEGFARGSNLSEATGVLKGFKNAEDFSNALNQLEDQIAKLSEAANAAYSAARKSVREKGYTDEAERLYDESIRIEGEAQPLRAKVAALRTVDFRDAFDAYSRVAGEIEARDVQARQKLTPEQRAATEPYSSENIAPEDAIVLFGSGPQASVQFASDYTAAESAGNEAARSTLYSERDMDIREAIRRAYEAMPKKNSVAVPIGELFAKTEELMPGVTQDEFSNVLQDLFEDNGAVLQEGDVVEPLTEQDRRYLALAEDEDANREELQRMVNEAAKVAGYNVSGVGNGITYEAGDEPDSVYGERDNVMSHGGAFGFYFSDNPTVWSDYAKPRRKGEKGRVNQTLLSLKNPFRFSKEFVSYDDLQALLRDGGIALPAEVKSRLDRLVAGGFGDTQPVWKWLHPTHVGAGASYGESLKKSFTDAGYDGVIHPDSSLMEGGLDTPATSYVVFSPSQIKSADPVTRDDQERIIPLSRRFDTGADIRGQINVTTPEGRRAGFVVVMPRAAKASRIKAEDASDAAKTFQADIIEAGKGRIDTDSYQGNTLKSTEAPDHNVNASELYKDAAISLVDSLLKKHSITDIANSFQDPEFRVAVGLLGNKAINPNVAQQAELFTGAEIQNRLENSLNKERNPTQKRLIEKTLKNHKAYYTVATGIGQNLNAVGALQQDPRFKWMFLFNEAEKEMADKAKDKLDTITGGGTQPVTDMVNQSEEAAADEATKEMTSDAEEDQDAIDLAAGEETLDERLKRLYEELKDWLRTKGAIVRARAARKSANAAKASLSKEQRDAIMQMSDEELDALEKKADENIERILNTILGKESDAKTAEQKKTRAKRKKMVETAKKRADAGKSIDISDTESAVKIVLREMGKARPGKQVPLTKLMPWKDILAQKAKTVEEYRQRILDVMMASDAFKEVSDEDKAKISDIFAKQWDKKRTDILDRMLEREIDRKRREGSLSEAAAKALQKSRNKIIELANLGGFDNDDLMKVLGEKFGIKTGFSEAEKARISELADKLQDETLNPAKRNKLAMEFAVTLAGASEIPVAEIIANWWTSSVLFGPQTIFSIGAAFVNGAYGITTIGTRRMLADLTRGDVKGAIEESILMLQGIAKYLGAFKQAGRRAWSYLWTGNVDVLGAAANDILGEINSLEELKRFKRHKLLAENLAKDPRALRRYVGMYLRFVNRLLTSLDAFNVMVTKAGTASLALRMSGMSTDNIIKAEKMLNLKSYKDQVIRDYFDNKAPTTQAEKALVDSYAEAEMYRAVDQLGGKMENADYLASESAMTMNPTGLGGFFYRSITGLDSKMKKAAEDYLEKAKKDWTTEKDLESTLFLGLAYLRQFAVQNLGGVAGYKFIRFASNKFNQGISYLPMVGLLRTLEAKGDEIKGKEAFIETIHRNQVIGAVLTLAAIAVVKALEDEPDDEERGNFWNGGWQNLTPDQKKQMLAKGQKEYTMGFKFNGRWYVFNYQNWPLNQVLAAIGSMSDQIRFSPKQWEEKGPLSKSLAGIVSGLKSTLEIPALSQLGELAGNRLASKDPTEQTVDRLSRVAAGWVGGFVPRILKDLDFATQPELRKYKTLWEKTASHIPIYRRYVGEDYYDILGQPIKRNVIPGSREFMMGPTEPEYKILGALNSRNIFLTPANAEYRMVGKGRNRRRLTQEEADAYSLETGKGYRQMLLRYGQRALQMPTERARAFLSDKADEVRDRALKKVFRR